MGARSDHPKAGLQMPQTDLRGFEWRYLWKLCQGEELFTLRGHSNRVVSVAFDRTGTWLASTSDDRTVRIWNADRREPAQVLPIGERVLTSVAFSPSNDVLAIGGSREVRIREGSGWNSERLLTNAHGPLVFAPDGRSLVTDGQRGNDVLGHGHLAVGPAAGRPARVSLFRSTSRIPSCHRTEQALRSPVMKKYPEEGGCSSACGLSRR